MNDVRIDDISSDAAMREERDRAFYADLQKNELSAFWKVIPKVKKPVLEPQAWRWPEVRRLLMQAGEIVKPGEGAERRVLLCSNPANAASTTSALTAAIQLIQPGEVASSHRHTMAAIRFIISGSGAFTDVEGERLFVEPYDLILTPSWTWHGHGNETGEPVIWLDGLDAPLVRGLLADAFEPDKTERHAITKRAGHTRRATGTHWMRPPGAALKEAQPAMVYRWADVLPELMALPEEYDDPHDGAVLEYVNPATNGPTLPTISCRVQMLRPRVQAKPHRHSASAIYYVVKGAGHAVIDGKRLEWSAGDIWSIPAGSAHALANPHAGEAILFSYTEAPALEKLGLYREEPL
jgi:gentisate 1,2-dioxygenase